MNKETWITIMAIAVPSITAFIAPLLNSWLQHKLTLARERSTINQSKDKTEGIDKSYRRVQVLLFVICILPSLIALVWELSRSIPVTQDVVFRIALYIGIITFSSVVMLLLKIEYTRTNIFLKGASAKALSSNESSKSEQDNLKLPVDKNVGDGKSKVVINPDA